MTTAAANQPRRSASAVCEARGRGGPPARDGSIGPNSAMPLGLMRAASATGWSIGRGDARSMIFLGERASVDAPWTTVTYRARACGGCGGRSWILAQGLSAERPLAILSDNASITRCSCWRHACRRAGRAMSPAYSLVSKISTSSRA